MMLRQAVCLLVLVPLAAASLPAQAPQPPQPPRPEHFKVKLRYQIRAARDQHVALYDAMVEHLKGLGFIFEPPLEERPREDREDPSKERMEGLIAPDKALRLLADVSVANLLLLPDDFKLADEPDAPVHVRLQLASGYQPARQRELAEQVLVLLRRLGFREAVGYDPRGYDGRPFSRIVGVIPRGKLDALLRDLRTQPTGWLAPIVPQGELPDPVRGVNPVPVVEVLRDASAVTEFAVPAPRSPAYLAKLSPQLWEIVDAKEEADKPIRFQVVLAGAPRDSRAFLMGAAPGIFVEGQLGQFVTALGLPAHIKELAARPEVVTLRLPMPARVDADPALKPAGDDARVLAQSGVAELHRRGATGKRVRLGIIDTDFRGWRKLVSDGKLPAQTRMVDLTTESDPQVRPAAETGAEDEFGHGTLCAQAAALAAPDAELTLIRLAGIAPYQLDEVLRHVESGFVSAMTERRRDELVAIRAILERRRSELLQERRIILENFADETALHDEYDFLGAVMGWIFSDREWHRQRVAYQERLEADLRRRDERFTGFVRDLQSLRGIQVLANPLGWNSSYPAGVSPLGGAFAEQPPNAPLWFQSAGNTRGQSWLGPYRSLAGAAALQFADSGAPLPVGRWTTELNFLAWQPHEGAAVADLPDKVSLRLTLQWREPHDPDYFLPPGEPDPYQQALAGMRLVLLRQRDPEAKAVPGDAFDVVARSTGVPTRLEHRPGSSFYELALDVNIDQPGRYAVRIEKQTDTRWELVPHPTRPEQVVLRQVTGLTPTGSRPLGAPVLPGLDRNWELQLHLFVETTDDASRRQGRAVLADFRSDAGAIGVPAAARGVFSVGAVDLKDRPQPYSAVGTPMLAELNRLPLLWTYDSIDLAGGAARGASVATAYAAGTTAALLSSGVSQAQAAAWLRGRSGEVLRVPSRAASR
jgi:hypothetical protein